MRAVHAGEREGTLASLAGIRALGLVQRGRGASASARCRRSLPVFTASTRSIAEET